MKKRAKLFGLPWGAIIWLTATLILAVRVSKLAPPDVDRRSEISAEDFLGSGWDRRSNTLVRFNLDDAIFRIPRKFVQEGGGRFCSRDPAGRPVCKSDPVTLQGLLPDFDPVPPITGYEGKTGSFLVGDRNIRVWLNRGLGLNPKIQDYWKTFRRVDDPGEGPPNNVRYGEASDGRIITIYDCHGTNEIMINHYITEYAELSLFLSCTHRADWKAIDDAVVRRFRGWMSPAESIR